MLPVTIDTRIEKTHSSTQHWRGGTKMCLKIHFKSCGFLTLKIEQTNLGQSSFSAKKFWMI